MRRIRRSRLRVRAVAATLLGTLLLSGPGRVAEAREDVVIAVPGNRADAALGVAVSIPPLAWMVERIGGSHVRVSTLIPPFAAPEHFAPRPRQLEAVAQARLFVLVGHPALVFERRFVRPLLDERPELARIDFYAASAPTESAEAGLPSPEPGDPHVWLSPGRVARAAPSIASALSILDPANAGSYEAGLRALTGEIAALEERLLARFGRTVTGQPARAGGAQSNRFFLVQHPAWGWLMRDYPLSQLAIEREGKEPGPRRMVALIAWSRLAGVRRVLSESGQPGHSARLIAREIDAEIVSVDPMARDWLANLERVSEQIEAASVSAPPGLKAP